MGSLDCVQDMWAYIDVYLSICMCLLLIYIYMQIESETEREDGKRGKDRNAKVDHFSGGPGSVLS